MQAQTIRPLGVESVGDAPLLPPIENPDGLMMKLAYFASEHLYNMTNIGLNIHSDMLCDIRKKA